MSKINLDPLEDIRKAVVNALRTFEIDEDDKLIVDRIVDYLPDFFRQTLISKDLGYGFHNRTDSVRAYLFLTCNLKEVKRYVASDLLRALAERILEETEPEDFK